MEDVPIMVNRYRSATGYRRPIASVAVNPPIPASLIFALAVGLAILFAGFATMAHSEVTAGDPMAVVKGTVGQVLAVLQDKQTPSQSRRRKVLEIVDRRFDFADMARSSLGYNWKKLRPDQQQQFVPLFTAFMEEAYISKIDGYAGQKVQYIGQSSTGSDQAEVKTVVQPVDANQQPIRINYQLKLAAGDWKVYDVTVDDISITANYRNQFNHVINEKGFDALMSAMREKQQELRQSIGA